MQLAPCALNLAVENSVLTAPTNYLGSDTGYPDWTTLRTRALLDPLYASVMCTIARDHGPQPKQDNFCPRRALKTVLSKASQRFQLEFMIGFEVEFEVWRRNEDDKLVLHSTGLGGAACSGLRHGCYEYVEETMMILLEAGVGLEAMHTEGQKGQYEFCLAPKRPMEAVDELVFVHDTLKRVFTRHGLIVTMFPRPAADRTQSIGQHVHISIGNRPELEVSFLAGILRHLPSLIALCLPYDMSYARLRPGQGGSHIVAWGTQDRRVPVRKVKSCHWELRCVDATANMCLVLAATLSAGLLGCMNREVLQFQDTSSLSEEEIIRSGDVYIPGTFEAALDQLERVYESEGQFKAIERSMESQVIRHYLEMKRFELSKLTQMGADEARSLLIELF
ncbi:glutamine synthetase, catalytic domain-containing protein [Hirsutella rhossiliensis]|uniref:Glutamine synthetase, catalytic domain-containing protein n=1 Tax=Hirsutella rhossiliensis TaxID=111463 RepID=A0A9P8MZ04_9HYPO|nr:glutamine synthetase, catalytic domain-containing protein [Hirsutella rhossiliensis]KAH0963895.1 glutamine synthetase, catalytic domain-containing protein [Hirsutella rhossiliensis]